MATTVSVSDTVIGSLCREVDGIRQRGTQLAAAIGHCQDSGLLRRLRLELQQLQRRCRELRGVALFWRNHRQGDSLAIDFLIEICSRPLPG